MTAKLQGVSKQTKEKIKGLGKISFPKNILALMLFGSFANENETPLSDVDLAYLPVANGNKTKQENIDNVLYHQLAKHLATDDITLVNLRESPALLAFAALQGKLLFCRNKKAFAEYKEKVLNVAPDIAQMRSDYAKNYLRALSR